MRNFQEAFETPKRSFISAFSVCMTVPLDIIKVICRNQAVDRNLHQLHARITSKPIKLVC